MWALIDVGIRGVQWLLKERGAGSRSRSKAYARHCTSVLETLLGSIRAISKPGYAAMG